MRRRVLVALVALSGSFALLHSAKLPKDDISPDVQAALDRISVNSLRGNLSFIASDMLEGRGTPSRGLDIAAEYIAAQFRRAGLEPGVNSDYFQVADIVVKRPNMEGFSITFNSGKKEVTVAPDEAVVESDKALDLKPDKLFKLPSGNSYKPVDLEGKIVVVQFKDARAVREQLTKAHPALIVLVGKTSPGTFPKESLIDPTQQAKDATNPRVIIFSAKMDEFANALKAGENEASATIHVAAPIEEHAKIRNVIGVLRGSDASLKDTYVMVTAHYDHLGMKDSGTGDRIYNGANDDGSGTVSVMEIANALAGLKKHPARSIVFMTFFGEEEGLIGSKYYLHHPVFPLAKTVADINLEQVGRTDSTKGKQIANIGPTGYSYSSVIDVVRAAGDATGVKVYDPGLDSDRFFAESDNYDFAEAGIPAHSFCVAFMYSDYHGLGDEWQKIDFDNMAKVDRTFALGALMIANDPAAPHWNKDNPKAKRFADARKQ